MIGLIGAGLQPIYSMIIAVGIYVGIKVYVGRRQAAITKDMPEGICAECGAKIAGGACPNCDK